MPMYIGDYLRDTRHLSTLEHGAYFLLIMDAWTHGGLLPGDEKRLARIAGMSPKEWAASRDALLDFFDLTPDGYRHGRVDKELGTTAEIVGARSAGGAAKWGSDNDPSKRGRDLRSQRLAEARKKGTHTPLEWDILKEVCGGVCVRCGADVKMVKDHITPIYQGGSDALDNLQPLCQPCNSSKGPEAEDHRPKGWRDAFKNAFEKATERLQNALPSPSPSQDDIPNGTSSKGGKRVKLAAKSDDVADDVWSDFQCLRRQKRAPLTETAMKGIEREAAKAGWTLDAALRECCERGWQVFKADWVNGNKGKSNGNGGRPSGWLS